MGQGDGSESTMKGTAPRPRTMRRLWGFVRPYRRVVAAALAFMVGFSIVNALTPFLVISGASLADKEPSRLDVLRRLGQRLFDVEAWPIVFVVIAVLVLFSLRGLFDYAQAYLMEWVGKRVIRDLRDTLYWHLQRLSVGFFATARTGELISRVTNDILIVEDAVSRVFLDMFLQPVAFATMMAAAGYISWQLALVCLVGIPVVLFPLLAIGRRVRRGTSRVQRLLANLTAILQESFSGVRVVKAFNMEAYEVEKFARENQRVCEAAVSIARKLHVVRPIIDLIGGLAIIGAIVVGFEVLGMQLKEILGFSAALVLLYGPAKKLSALNNRLQIGLAAADRIFEMLDRQPKVVDAPTAQLLPRLARAIEYAGVTFAYDTEPVLHDVTFAIGKGEVVALVGPSGSGKTTIVNLLLRFYDPTAGRILLDGHDIRLGTLASLRGQMGIVTQETILFNDTARANIAYGRPETAHGQIVAAAKAANAHGFIEALPDGYETVIGERGVKLSGGQQQRLAIARAVLKNPPILVLDEATSALDTESERLVQQAIERLVENRTVLVIAHRLSTIQHADRIIVLDRGRIVQTGTHSALLATGGLYKRLYEMQFNF